MEIKNNYPMSALTTLRIGGKTKFFVSVSTEEELTQAIKYAKENSLEFFVIGGGSNLLVSDEGLDKLVIENKIPGLHLEGIKLNVKSGTPLQDLVNFSLKNGLAGLEKLTGIPGTVGGAIYGNAGAYGQTISDNLVEVKALNPLSCEIVTLTKEECVFSYRDSIFKKNKYIILEATFKLEIGDPKILQQKADETLTKRLIKYPKGIKCPGSFFKNIIASTLPQEILDRIPAEKIVYGKLPAGALLEMVGAKGDCLDEIEIAPYHANLFINNGNGSAKAFYTLAKKWAQKVQEKFGITLEPEVQLINLPPLL